MKRSLNCRTTQKLVAALAMVAFSSCLTTALFAQQSRPLAVIGLGMVVPGGDLGRDRTVGPLVRVGIESQSRGRAEIRLDAEMFRLRDKTPVQSMMTERGTLTSIGVIANALIGARRGTVRPYGIIAVGIQGVHSNVPDSYPGIFLGVRGGAGVAAHVRSVRLSVEMAPFVSALGYGGGALTFGPTPLSVGIAF